LDRPWSCRGDPGGNDSGNEDCGNVSFQPLNFQFNRFSSARRVETIAVLTNNDVASPQRFFPDSAHQIQRESRKCLKTKGLQYGR
jgi:hypothetical protein